MNISVCSNVLFLIDINGTESLDTKIFYSIIRRKKQFGSVFLLRITNKKYYGLFTKYRNVIFFYGRNENNASVIEKFLSWEYFQCYDSKDRSLF